MSVRHEIPTHLEVEDKILFGLTLRQGLIAIVGLSLSFWLWRVLSTVTIPPGDVTHSGMRSQQLRAAGEHLSVVVVLVLAGVPALFALALAWCQPFGRPLEEWLFAALRFAALPKRYLWRPRLATLSQSAPSLQEHERGTQQHTVTRPPTTGRDGQCSSAVRVSPQQMLPGYGYPHGRSVINGQLWRLDDDSETEWDVEWFPDADQSDSSQDGLAQDDERADDGSESEARHRYSASNDVHPSTWAAVAAGVPASTAAKGA